MTCTKLGSDFTGRPAATADSDPSKAPGTGHSKTAQKILRAQKQPPAPTLFLGNLGFNTTVESIRDLLAAHRAVKKKGKDVPDAAEEAKDHAQDKDTAQDKDIPQEKLKGQDAWLRKVRMGTFEDSGLCKGCVPLARRAAAH